MLPIRQIDAELQYSELALIVDFSDREMLEWLAGGSNSVSNVLRYLEGAMRAQERLMAL